MRSRNTLLLVLAVVLLAAVAATAVFLHAHHRAPAPDVSHPATSLTAVDQAADRIQDGPLTPERQRTFATLACGKPVTVNPKGEIVCPVCPQNSDFATSPGEFGGWTYSGMLFGHFTAGNADEALLNGQGCESHANNYGGNFLLRKQAGTWALVRYLSGSVINDKCLRLPWPAGPDPGSSRDALICNHGDMHSGEQEMTVVLFTVAPAAPPDGPILKSGSFLFLTDTTMICSPTHENPVQSASIDKLSLLPAGANGLQDVEIDGSIGRADVKLSSPDCPYNVPAKPFRLLFHNAGDHLDGTEALRQLNALQPAMREGASVDPSIVPIDY